MGNFSNVVVTTATPVAITASQWGNTINISEDLGVSGASYPISDLLIYHVAAAGGATAIGRRIPAGSSYTFTKGLTVAEPYGVGEIAGYVKSVSGTLTIIVDEGGA